MESTSNSDILTISTEGGEGRREIRIAGFGGQGIVLSTVILGKAVSMFMNKNAVVMQNYGPESRGGACAGTVVIDDQPVDYPYATNPDLVIIMSKEAFSKYHKKVKPGGIMMVDEDLVELCDYENQDVEVYKIPSTRMAEQMGRKIIANIIMLGALCGISDLVEYNALKEAVLSLVPPKTRHLNEKAILLGYEYGKKLVRERKESIAVPPTP